MTAVVTIPAYKEHPSPNEVMSYNRCLEVLGSHPITVFAPRSLNTSVYERREVSIKRFDDRHFTSVRAYSHLMLETGFYEAFSEFDHLLIYQLDAYVFDDQLQRWCDAGYDYIGAPWVGVKWLTQPAAVGNGGFSLRSVKKALEVLRSMPAHHYPMNEDGFWSFVAPLCPTYRLAPVEEALKFSFDRNPAQCFELAGRKLPFGCHAWESDPFWKPYIPSS